MEKLMQKENVYIGSKSEGSSDFKDVFGGPPRRFSMQEVGKRYSFGESSSPVFGEERRRRKGADFFDDIFKGSPRSRDRDRDRDRESSVFGSSPGSMIMSPARPFSPKPLPLPSFLPASFSLPAKSPKGMDLPTFGSNNHGQHKVDGGSNGLSNSYSWSPFSRLSNEASRSLDDMIRNEVQPVRPLSEEAEDSPFNAIISDKEEISENSNKDMRNVDRIGNQFHFSIYKWEAIGVPMLMPHVIRNNLKSNVKLEKSCSSNGRMQSRSSSVRNQERAQGENKQEQNYVAEAFYELSESRSKSRPNDSAAFDTSAKENRVKLADGSNAGEKIEKEVPVKIIEETKDNKARDPEGGRGDARDSKKVKEKGSKGLDLSNAKVEKPNLQGAVTNLGEADGKSAAAATRKVKEFVHIFNQETDSRPKADVLGSWRRGNVDIDQKGNEEVNSNQEKVKEQVNLHNVDKKPDVSFKFQVVEDLKNNEAQRIYPKRSSSSSRSSSRLRKSFSAGKLLEDFLMSQENLDDPLEDNFEVHELSDDNEIVSQNESSEDRKAIDAKIRQWSVGKKGNIRSLLSTLQYVLWAESGWKAVPLVDLIEANSVKKAYQKALLRLHPDKLQQKGADFQHKYIAEKVFDILQEAWDHFNTCSSLGI